MPTKNTRWNLVVTKDFDKSVRQFLAANRNGEKGELSRFVTEAVNRHIFDSIHKAILEQNRDVPFEEIEAAVEESLVWARAQMR